MRPVFQAVICVLALSLSACELKLNQAKTPPPPQPTVAKAEPPPEPPSPVEPLSTPQTHVQLPDPQPIDPEAVVTPPPYVADASAQRSNNKKKRVGAEPRVTPQAKPEVVETAEAPPPAPETHRLEPVIPENQRIQKMEEISARLKDVDQTLLRVKPENEAQRHIWDQIRNFADQAYRAKDQGDIQKASGLTDRAQLLLQDLSRAR